MPLPPLLKRRSADAPSTTPTDATELQARTRARRRLIGAAVLLVVGVITFPLLFETQPRPVPVDIPLVIPSREGAPPLVAPARSVRADSGTIASAAASASGAAAAPAARAASPAATASASAGARPIEKAPEPAAAKPVEKAADKPANKAGDAPAAATAKPAASAAKPEPRKPEAKAEQRAEPKVEPKADTKPDAKGDDKGARYVVQVGAYNDEASAREVRQKVEKLGLKTYTQAVDVQGTRRIRVRIGPFESAQEANKALAALKAAKLPGAVLTL